MPIYFFNITRNNVSTRTETGLNLFDINAAWEHASTAASELIKKLDGSLEVGTDWSIVVEDEFRNKLRTITVSARLHK